jgi:hypothetical protein
VLELPVQQQVRPAPGRNAVITRCSSWPLSTASSGTRVPAQRQRLELSLHGWACTPLHCTTMHLAAAPRGPPARSAPCIGSKPPAPLNQRCGCSWGACAGPHDAIACPLERVLPLSSALHRSLADTL